MLQSCVCSHIIWSTAFFIETSSHLNHWNLIAKFKIGTNTALWVAKVAESCGWKKIVINRASRRLPTIEEDSFASLFGSAMVEGLELLGDTPLPPAIQWPCFPACQHLCTSFPRLLGFSMIHNDTPPTRHTQRCFPFFYFACSIHLAAKLAASLWMYPFLVQWGRIFQGQMKDSEGAGVFNGRVVGPLGQRGGLSQLALFAWGKGTWQLLQAHGLGQSPLPGMGCVCLCLSPLGTAGWLITPFEEVT